MALIRVRCPACRAELEIDDQHTGQEVECGSCLQVFVVERPKEQSSPAETRRPRRDRRDEEEDDFDYDRPSRRRRSSSRSTGGGIGLAVTSLVLGIVGIPLVCCWPFAIPIQLAAAICGAISMGHPEGKGMAIAGLVLSIIGLVLSLGIMVLGIGMNMARFN
jgi:predicted Zn finger-like uncharacterized protein